MIQIPLIEGHHRPVSETFRCCADDGPTWMLAWKLCDFFRGSGPVALRNPIFL